MCSWLLQLLSTWAANRLKTSAAFRLSCQDAVLASSKLYVLAANKCTIAVSALVEAFGRLGIRRLSLARHSKVPMVFGFPPLAYLGNQSRSTSISLDVAWS